MGINNKIAKSIQKLTNLHRLDLRNSKFVLSSLFKMAFGMRRTEAENSAYRYYQYLICKNGFLRLETDSDYVGDFKGRRTNTIKLRKKPSSDIKVFQQVFVSSEYFPVVNAYRANFKEEDPVNIIDAGSNIGLTSLYFTENFAQPRIICIEPEPENFKVMNFNLSNKENIIKINGAVWNSDSRIQIVNDFRDQADWSFRVIESDDPNAMKAYSIGGLAEKFEFKVIDILKIDVEGSEKQIFTTPGIEPEFLSITKCVSVEIHDEFNCREDIYQVLTKYGFDFFNDGELTIGVNKNLMHKK